MIASTSKYSPIPRQLVGLRPCTSASDGERGKPETSTKATMARPRLVGKMEASSAFAAAADERRGGRRGWRWWRRRRRPGAAPRARDATTPPARRRRRAPTTLLGFPVGDRGAQGGRSQTAISFCRPCRTGRRRRGSAIAQKPCQTRCTPHRRRRAASRAAMTRAATTSRRCSRRRRRARRCRGAPSDDAAARAGGERPPSALVVALAAQRALGRRRPRDSVLPGRGDASRLARAAIAEEDVAARALRTLGSSSSTSTWRQQDTSGGRASRRLAVGAAAVGRTAAERRQRELKATRKALSCCCSARGGGAAAGAAAALPPRLPRRRRLPGQPAERRRLHRRRRRRHDAAGMGRAERRTEVAGYGCGCAPCPCRGPRDGRGVLSLVGARRRRAAWVVVAAHPQNPADGVPQRRRHAPSGCRHRHHHIHHLHLHLPLRRSPPRRHARRLVDRRGSRRVRFLLSLPLSPLATCGHSGETVGDSALPAFVAWRRARGDRLLARGLQAQGRSSPWWPPTPPSDRRRRRCAGRCSASSSDSRRRQALDRLAAPPFFGWRPNRWRRGLERANAR